MKQAIKTSIITTLVAGNVAIVSLSPALTFAKDKASEIVSRRPSISIEAGKILSFQKFKSDKQLRGERAQAAFEKVAEWLNLSKEEFFKQWEVEGSIAKVTVENGKTVDALRAYLINESEEQINNALEDGKVSSEIAERMREKREHKLEFLLYQAKSPKGL